MTDRDRLIELLVDFNPYKDPIRQMADRMIIEKIADYLLANGVILPPCKVGRTLYFLYDNTFANRPDFTPKIYETNDWYFDIDQKSTSILPRSIHGYKGEFHYYLNKTVFLTKEEAEKALKEREGK